MMKQCKVATGCNSPKQALFIHIPKCAGISLAKTLQPHIEVHRIGPHSKYQHIFGTESELIREEIFTFTFVRDPWARLVSTFFYIMQGGRAEIDKRRRDRYLKQYKGNFRRFVRDIESWFDIQEEDSIYKDRYIPHFRPQYEFIIDASGQPAVDFIGRVETITEDFTRLCRELDIPGLSLAKSNKSTHLKYQAYYDEETSAIVADYYARDIELFNYTFSPEKSDVADLMKYYLSVLRKTLPW